MKRFFILTVFSFLFFSCSGYWGNDREMDGGAALAPLAIQGGGYLSSDTANDITPFLFRDPYTGKAYLFFSSDRDGSYDIFYARMNDDGTFLSPIKLGTNVNTSNPEFSPVVFLAHSMTAMPIGTNLYISIVQVTLAGSNTNVVTFYLSNDFKVYTTSYLQLSGGFKHVSVISKTNITPRLICSLGTTNVQQSSWDTNVSAGPCWKPVTVLSSSFTNNVYSTSGYMISVVSNTSYFLLDALSGGKRKFFFLYNQGSFINIFATIPAYISSYNDRDVDIDLQTMKIYFSSDRFGRGNFDLYRYNHVTFDKIIP